MDIKDLEGIEEKALEPLKKTILFYSDCRFFAGCENMIANFLNSQILNDEFSVAFAYRYTELYTQGLNSRVLDSKYKRFPLRLMKQTNYQRPMNYSFLGFIAHKFFFAIYIFFNKYISIFVNTAILFRFFKQNKIDILHINNGGYPAAHSCYSAVIAARMVGINKIIYVVNNIAQDYQHPFRWLDYPIDFFIKKWVTFFITGSEHAGKRLKKVLKLSEKKQLTINNGIKKRAITLSIEEFKKKYSIPENNLIISVVANLEKRKGHIFLLEAVKQIVEQYPPASIPYFIFEGMGPEKDNLKNFILKNRLTDYVLMVDFIPHIFNLLNASDIVVLPSVANEDFPNVIIEAMSLGKPVIATEIAGIPEQIENNNTGIIVKPRNAFELKLAIMKLVSNPSLIQQFSINAKKRFDTYYEESISVRKYLDLYKSII